MKVSKIRGVDGNFSKYGGRQFEDILVFNCLTKSPYQHHDKAVTLHSHHHCSINQPILCSPHGYPENSDVHVVQFPHHMETEPSSPFESRHTVGEQLEMLLYEQLLHIEFLIHFVFTNELCRVRREIILSWINPCCV